MVSKMKPSEFLRTKMDELEKVTRLPMIIRSNGQKDFEQLPGAKMTIGIRFFVITVFVAIKEGFFQVFKKLLNDKVPWKRQRTGYLLKLQIIR